MTVKDLVEKNNFKLISEGNLSLEIKNIYCCDLLSVVMSKAPSECAWITVMSNINAVAVASLAEMSCIILAEGSTDDEIMVNKAKLQNINVLKTELPVFEAALLVKEGF